LDKNILLELDEDDPNRFNLSKGFKHVFEVLYSSFLFIVVLIILFLIWIGTIFKEKL
jgi:hypothetical protein